MLIACVRSFKLVLLVLLLFAFRDQRMYKVYSSIFTSTDTFVVFFKESLIAGEATIDNENQSFVYAHVFSRPNLTTGRVFVRIL